MSDFLTCLKRRSAMRKKLRWSCVALAALAALPQLVKAFTESSDTGKLKVGAG